MEFRRTCTYVPYKMEKETSEYENEGVREPILREHMFSLNGTNVESTVVVKIRYTPRKCRCQGRKNEKTFHRALICNLRVGKPARRTYTQEG